MNDITVFQEVDNIIDRAVSIGDPVLALEFGSELGNTARLKGYALAKLLYELKVRWNLFESAGVGENLSTLVEVHVGISPVTFEKYVRMWESIYANENVGTDVKDILFNRPIGDSLLLTAAVRDGSIAGDELKEVALTADQSTLREKIREKRGDKTSSASAVHKFVCMVDKPNMKAGTIYATKNGELEVIGYFTSPKTDFGMEAVNSIINASRMREVYR